MGIFTPKPEPEVEPKKEEAEAKLEDRELEEHERVAAWRVLTLMDHGYPLEIAEQIARRGDIDIEEARRLTSVIGCTPVDAARILL